jgi:hypothetical protein
LLTVPDHLAGNSSGNLFIDTRAELGVINTIYEPVFNNDMNTTLVELSKFLSLVLRHKPDVLGLVLDPQGWIPVADLLALTCSPRLVRQ